MAHLHLNELSLICDMWLNKITYLLTYLCFTKRQFEREIRQVMIVSWILIRFCETVHLPLP